jgi:hypothetical protein
MNSSCDPKVDNSYAAMVKSYQAENIGSLRVSPPTTRLEFNLVLLSCEIENALHGLDPVQMPKQTTSIACTLIAEVFGQPAEFAF